MTLEPDPARLPNLFVLGSAKSGTTSLFALMAQVPSIYNPPIKEPNFFATDLHLKMIARRQQFGHRHQLDAAIATRLAAGRMRGMHDAVVTRLDVFMKLYEAGATFRWRPEFSTSYLRSTQAAANIARLTAEPRVVLVLRDPVRRCLAHYRMSRALGYFTGSLRQALQLERAGLPDAPEYLAYSRYAEGVRRFQAAIPADRLKIVIFEDLVRQQDAGIGELAAFLSLDRHDFPGALPHVNQASAPRRFIGARLLRSPLLQSLKAGLPPAVRSQLRPLTVRPAEPVPGEALFIEELIPEFAQEVLELERMLGRRLPWLGSKGSKPGPTGADAPAGDLELARADLVS